MGFGFELAVYAELAWALCDAGFATLRYDKRSCNKENQCYENNYPLPNTEELTVHGFMDDTLAAVDYLSKQDGIEENQVFILGHSQAAQFVPHLMKASKKIRAGIMVAAPYQPVDRALAGQLQRTEDLLEDLDIHPKFVESATEDLSRWVRELRELREARFQGDTIGPATTRFWKSWMDIGDQAPTVARTLRRPLFVISGDYDWNVPPKETRDWEDWLKYNSRTQHQVMLVADVTHALNEVHERDVAAIKPEHIERHISPKVTAGILNFLADVIQIDKENNEISEQKTKVKLKASEDIVTPERPLKPKVPIEAKVPKSK